MLHPILLLQALALKSSEKRKTAELLRDPDLEEKTSSNDVNFAI
jgi:hypothetical protein